ncbi:MAG: DcaP family trimeric outer membrane transporter, partial [Stellaceae bacterium]
TNYIVVPQSKDAAGNIIVKPIFEAGASAGYQHWWWPNLRSNVTFGLSREQIPSQLVGPLESVNANKQVMTAHVNLIWSPVAFVDTGIEYMWGQRLVVANIRGTEQALIGKFAVKF